MTDDLIRALAEERVSVVISPNIVDSVCLDEQDKTTVCGHLVDFDFTEHDRQVIERYLAEHNVDDNEECCEELPDAMKKMSVVSKRVAIPFEIDKCVRHEAVCTLLNDIYQQKNAAYGDSFGNTYRELGIISAVTRISDKFNRLKTLVRNSDMPTGDESIGDTLLDMANYCIMTYMEMESECSGRNCKNDL